MNISKYLNITLGILLIILLGYTINLKTTINKEDKKESNQQTGLNQEEKEYDCSFTKTYNIVNTLDGYIAEVEELSYIVLDQYQSHSAFTHIIPSKLKVNLEKNKSYEFTYTIKGTGNITDMEDIYDSLSSTTLYEENKENNYPEPKLLVTLSIKKTDKKGMEQVQENICQN